MPKPCARCGRTSDNDIGDRIRRIKKEIVTERRGESTGVTSLDEARLIEEIYTLLLVMNIFTKPGGLWHDPQSPCWPHRTEIVMNKMEEIFL